MALAYNEEAYDMSLFETEELSFEELEEKRKIKKQQLEESKIAQQKREKLNRIIKMSVLGAVSVSLIAFIIVGQVQLTELNQQIVNERKTLEEKQSLYIQTEMKVEAKYSSDIVEENAQGELGMSRADSYQKEYISLEEGDKAELTETQGKNIFEIIANAISSLWS